MAVRTPLYVIMVVSRTFARHNDVYKCRLVANGHKGRTLQNARHSSWELEVAMLSAEGSGPPGSGPPGNGPPGSGPPGNRPPGSGLTILKHLFSVLFVRIAVYLGVFN